MKWRVQQSNGVAMLKTISSDDSELKRLLSTEHYNRVMAALSAPVPSTSRVSQQASGSTGATVPRIAPTVPATTRTAVPSAPVQATTSNTSAAIGVTRPQIHNPSGQPPAKKRKMVSVNPGDVVDLT